MDKSEHNRSPEQPEHFDERRFFEHLEAKRIRSLWKLDQGVRREAWQIIGAFADEFGVPVGEIIKTRRGRQPVGTTAMFARKLCTLTLRKELGLRGADIGHFLGYSGTNSLEAANDAERRVVWGQEGGRIRSVLELSGRASNPDWLTLLYARHDYFKG